MKKPAQPVPQVASAQAVRQVIAAGNLPKGVDRYRASVMLVRVAALVRNTLDAGLAKDGLSASRLEILALLWSQPEQGASCSALAQALHVRPATITGLIDTLERQRLVRREAEASDARKWKLVLTAQGRALAQRALPDQAKRLHALTKGLTERQATQLIAALEVIAANVSSLTS